jgi:FAD/FMN-containing dehydrogenase/Fe-S oxidoreductase
MLKPSCPALMQALSQHLQGEVRSDPYSRVLYSTDASIYQIEPLGVVLPRTEEDVEITLRLAAEQGVPVLPRGAGTSLAGQSVGAALHLDCSKYLNRILELNVGERWVRVEPGVVLDELNAFLAPHGLQFGPDVATSNRATLGGMIGNNSAGARSILYGRTGDHIRSLRFRLAGGWALETHPLTPEELQAKLAVEGPEGDLYRRVQGILEAHHEEILARYPKVLRCVSGYNLKALVEDRPFDLGQLLLGSEGTLGVVTEATLNLVPKPARKALALIHFQDLLASLEATQEILPFGPAAVEVIDRMVLDLARQSPEAARAMTFVEGDPEAILMVEFYGDTEEELGGKIDRLEAHLRKAGYGYCWGRALTAAAQADVWKVRKAGVGLLMGLIGDAKPISFVEDTAVSVEQLPEFVRRFQALVAAQGTTASIYAHASVGCLHIRPVLNLKTAEGVATMRRIAEGVRDLVLEFGGAMSGEHGDGLARSEWNESLFGPQLYQAFREIKGAFDPHNLLNPGKIVDAPAMTENLRYGPGYRTRPIQTFLDFSREGGFDRAVELCNGSGVCRKKLEGTMCPSYQVTLEEEHSTRGRANVLRAILSGQLPPEEWTGERLRQVLDLCLACKGCRGECPSRVDMAKLKYEFLAHYHQAHGRPLRSWLFGHIALLNALGCRLAPLANGFLRTSLARRGLARLGIAPQRSLPPLARPTFEAWFKSRQGRKGENGKGKRGEGRRQVVLFHDTFLNFNYPSIGRAAVEVLEAAGWEVILPRKKCCGRPLISQGMLREAQANARYNVAQLAPFAEAGIPIVGCEPSCVLTLRDEYRDLIDDPRREVVAAHTFLIEEFLVQLHQAGELPLRFTEAPQQILFHGHCHQKALVGTSPTLTMLRWPPRWEVSEVDSGCCGMAGAFGFEREHYEFSLQVGAQRLFPAIQALPPEAWVVAPGASCRQQIEHATGRRAWHPIEALRAGLVLDADG